MIEAVGWKDFGTFFDALLATCSRPTGRCCCRRSRSTTAPTTVEKASKQLHPHATSSPTAACRRWRSSPRCVARDTDMRTVHLEDLTPHYAETLRRWRANFEARDGRARRARLRRALPAAVADVPVLLRGGLRRAPDRPRADRAGQAALARRSPPLADGAARGGYAPRLPAEHPAAERVEHERGAARGELGERGLAAGAEDAARPPRRRARTLSAHSSGSTLSQPEVSM